jgi:hypothetical protein
MWIDWVNDEAVSLGSTPTVPVRQAMRVDSQRVGPSGRRPWCALWRLYCNRAKIAPNCATHWWLGEVLDARGDQLGVVDVAQKSPRDDVVVVSPKQILGLRSNVFSVSDLWQTSGRGVSLSSFPSDAGNCGSRTFSFDATLVVRKQQFETACDS